MQIFIIKIGLKLCHGRQKKMTVLTFKVLIGLSTAPVIAMLEAASNPFCNEVVKWMERA